MAKHEIRIDRSIPLAKEPEHGHNRWHPDIPPRVTCKPGDEVEMETRDAFDLQFHPAATLDDVANVDLNLVHPLTGPVYVEGAEPGDLLVVEILEVEPTPYAYTAQVPGFGFLRDDFPDPFIVKWDIADGWATSADLPGVRVPGAPFMGIMGLAPSRELLKQITAREQALLDRSRLRAPARGRRRGADRPARSPARRCARSPRARTAATWTSSSLPPGRGLFMPVWTEGALFSAGDAHFAQGDCEACGTAIEMAATLRVRFDAPQGRGRRARYPRHPVRAGRLLRGARVPGAAPILRDDRHLGRPRRDELLRERHRRRRATPCGT